MKRRVLMVADGLWNGGRERQMAQLLGSLPETWSASVLSLEDGPYRPVLEGLGIEVSVFPRRHRFDIAPAFAMWGAASERRPDVVHSWGWMSSAAMVPFCRLHGVPLLDGTIRLGRVPPRSFLDRIALSLSTAVVANSRAGLTAYGFTEGDRARVVYNGFDPVRLRNAAGPKPPHDGTVAIMAARMYPEKDWRLLLDAARSLATETPPLRFVAVGGGPDRRPLMSESADLVHAGSVEFPEGGLEILPLVEDADIGVLLTDPSLHAEGCSNSIMEYMACGLPVVCTDSGGNRELVEDGVTGILVPPDDVDAVCAALRLLRDDPARARAMGEEGRRRIDTRFTVPAMVAGFVAAYESLLPSEGGTRS